MIRDGLLFHENGNIDVYVNIQDGIEIDGPFTKESEAIASYKLGHKVLNGNDNKEPRKFRVVPVPSIQYELVEIK